MPLPGVVRTHRTPPRGGLAQIRSQPLKIITYVARLDKKAIQADLEGLRLAISMAGSRFAYVRNFELPDPLLPETYMVLRIDGHAFHRSVSI